MYKNILLVLFAVFMINTATFAQSEESQVYKGLTFYMCGGTGNINPDAGDLLNTWSETGLVFSQNFAKAQWFTVETTAAFCTETGSLIRNFEGSYVGNPAADYSITGYGKVNFKFARYFDLGFHTTGRIDLDFKYTFQLAKDHTLRLRAYLELHPTGSSFYGTVRDENSMFTELQTRNILSHMDYRITYFYAFHPQFGYESDLRFRFNGANGRTDILADSLTAVKESFSIRWNNTIYYENANGFGGYLQFRYQPNNIARPNKDIAHSIQLIAGLSYAYDLSAL